MPEISQASRLFQITTPLGPDKLLVSRFEGKDEISGLFRYTVDLVSEEGAISSTDIVGKRITVKLLLPDGSFRYFDGFVSCFSQMPSHGRLHVYRAEMVPWLWFLTRTTDCQIFQQKTVVQVIESVFKDLGFNDYKLSVVGSYQPINYCVQYRETAFNFVSRLMEKEGIFYFFHHEAGKHTMVIADKSSVHKPCDGEPKVPMDHGGRGTTRDFDVVFAWERHYQYCSGKWAQTDYNFKTPTTSLMTTENSILKIENNQKFEFYDYPGEYETKGAGGALTKLRMEEEEVGFDIGQGESDSRNFASGYKFTLAEHERKDQNVGYVLTSVTHSGSQGDFYSDSQSGAGSYRNRFSCIPEKVQFRPPRTTPHQIVHGCQTAVVVGPAGEEIYTDSDGRVKVQFFWDRKGKKDEKSSCWIRVSQPWAGKNWGAIWIPRIGQEVVVDFLEGDPDRPLIVGRVYNEQQTVPYALPGNSTQSGFKSRSSKGGGAADFNEIRFEDKKGSEEVYLHAQKDMTIMVEHDRTKTVQHDESTSITHDRTEKVGHDEKGTIGNNREWTIGPEDKLTVAQKQAVSIGQEQSIDVGQKITITAGVEITLTAGPNVIKLSPSGISIQSPAIVQIQGSLVKIN